MLVFMLDALLPQKVFAIISYLSSLWWVMWVHFVPMKNGEDVHKINKLVQSINYDLKLLLKGKIALGRSSFQVQIKFLLHQPYGFQT